MSQRRVIFALSIAVFIAISAGAVAASESASATVEGVTMPMSAEHESELKESVEQVASVFDVEMKDNVALLYANGEKWIVVADDPLPAGETTARGAKITEEEAPGSDVNLLFAESVKTTTKGDPVDIDDVVDNPEQYDQELVRVTTNYQQLTYNLEVSNGAIVEKRTMAQFEGYPLEMVPPGQSGRWAAGIGDSPDSPTDILKERIGLGKALAIDYQSTRYWMNSEAHVDVVVLHEGNGPPLLFIADVTPVAEETTIGAVQDGQHDGDVVTIESDVAEARISTKESLIKMAPCGTDAVTTPNGCVPAVADAVVHAGVMYDGVPEDRSDMLLYTAISNKLQTQPVELGNRRVRVTGGVVDADEVHPGAEGDRALVVYDIEYINHNSGAPSEAEAYRSDYRDEVQTQMTTSEGEYSEANSDDNNQQSTSASENSSSGGADSASGEAKFVIEEVSLPDTHDGEITASVIVRNGGDSRGEYDVVVQAETENESRGQFETVQLDPSEERTIRVSVGRLDDETNYDVYVNDDYSGSVNYETSVLGWVNNNQIKIGGAIGLLGLGIALITIVIGVLVWIKQRQGRVPNVTEDDLDKLSNLAILLFVSGLAFAFLGIRNFVISSALLAVGYAGLRGAYEIV